MELIEVFNKLSLLHLVGCFYYYVHHWYCNINSELDSTITILLIISISSTCFGRHFRPSSGALDCVYSLYNSPTMLPVGGSVHYTTSCKHSLVLLRMGENVTRNMLSWLKLLIKLLLLNLVRCLYYSISDVRNNRNNQLDATMTVY